MSGKAQDELREIGAYISVLVLLETWNKLAFKKEYGKPFYQ